MKNAPVVHEVVARKSNPVFLRIVSIFWGLLIPFASMLAIPSIMGVAAGMPSDLAGRFFLLSTLTLPLVLIISCAMGLIVSYSKDYALDPRTGRFFASLPLINVVMFIFGLQ